MQYFMEEKKKNKTQKQDLWWKGMKKHFSAQDFCTSFGYTRIDFLPSSLYGAMFWICVQNSVDNTGMF